MEISGPQWNSIVDAVNVALFHDFHDMKIDVPPLEVNLSVGESGFTLEVEKVEVESE